MTTRQRRVALTIDAPRASDLAPGAPAPQAPSARPASPEAQAAIDPGFAFDPVDDWAWEQELPEDRGAAAATLPDIPAVPAVVVAHPAARHRRPGLDLQRRALQVMTTGIAVTLAAILFMLTTRNRDSEVVRDGPPARDEAAAAPVTTAATTPTTALPTTTSTTRTATTTSRPSSRPSSTPTTSPPPPPPASSPLDLLLP